MISKVIVFLSLASVTFAAKCGNDYYGQTCTNGKYNTDGEAVCAAATCTEADCCTDHVAPKACTSWTSSTLLPNTYSGGYSYKTFSDAQGATAYYSTEAGCKATCNSIDWCVSSAVISGWGTYCWIYGVQPSQPGLLTNNAPSGVTLYECNQRGYKWWLQRAVCDSNAGCDATSQYLDTTKKCADTSCTSADQNTCCLNKAQCSSQTCATNYYVADPAKYCALQYCTNSDNCCAEAAHCHGTTCDANQYVKDTGKYCADPAQCTKAECCVDQDQCDGTSCNADRYVADTSKYCATDACTEAECCADQATCDANAGCTADQTIDNTKKCATDTCQSSDSNECCIDPAPTTAAPTTAAPTTAAPTTTSAPKKESDNSGKVIVGIAYFSVVGLVFSYALQGEAVNAGLRAVRIL